MARISFQDLKFVEEKTATDKIRANLYRLFYFYIDKEDLENIEKYKINNDGSIEFEKVNEQRARKKLDLLIAKNITGLKNSFNGRDAVYIHKTSHIPLIGNVAFGIIDRNTSIIEVKPITGCNLNCIYCSVGEGLSRKQCTDFVVEVDYLIEEFRKLVKFKNVDNVEAHIGTQGEPFLYSKIVELVNGLAETPNVSVVSIDTNGTLINEKLIDELAKAGLTRINLSINAIDAKKAREIAKAGYNIKHILNVAEYSAKKMEVILAPVLMQGINEEEMSKIIEFAKKIIPSVKQGKLVVGIQNFLEYSSGRTPVKQLDFKAFFEKLKKLEKKHNIRLIMDWSKDFNMKQTKKLQKPFDKEDVVNVKIICDGRFRGEKLAVPVEIAANRTITIPKCRKKGNVRVKITKSKHNIFYGKVVK